MCLFRKTKYTIEAKSPPTLQWRHIERDGVRDHQPHDCLLNRLFRRRSKKTPKPRVTGLCAGNSPVTGEFPTQRTRNAENVSIWWRHHESWRQNANDWIWAFYPAVLLGGILLQTCYYCGTEYVKSILKISMITWACFVINCNRTDKGFGQYAWYKHGSLLGMFGNMTLRIRGVRRPWGVLPALYYYHTSQQATVCTLRLIDSLIMLLMGWVHCSANLTEKMLYYQNGYGNFY